MKRAISLSLKLLANILILVHNAVPHQHHFQPFIDFIIGLDVEQADCLDHAHHTHSHKHNRQPLPLFETADIALFQTQGINDLALAQVQDIGSGYAEYLSVDDYSILDDFRTLQGNHVLSKDDSAAYTSCLYLPATPVRHKPYTAGCFSDFIACSKGLRAPPVC